MVNQNIIKAKINHIKTTLERLEEKQNISIDEFKRNKDLQDIVLHNLQLSIQGCIDIASHIISDEGWAVPDTLSGLFDILLKQKIIPERLNVSLKKMTGFRNIIIHEYQTIDLDKVYKILKEDLKDIYSFLKEVCIYAKI